MHDRTCRELFASAYDAPPDVVSSAPGRVNLIGEHTDYHQGFVLPTVIPQRTTVALRARDDRRARVISGAMGGDVREFAIGAESRDGSWLDYVQGVTASLAHTGFAASGFDAAITSTVPVGGGVSSSAALAVALLRALRDAGRLSADNMQIASLAHRAEANFVGAPIGVMDQIACSLGHAGEALFIDTRSLACDRIPIPANAGLIAIDSGLPHAHAGRAYRQRRVESFAAATALRVRWLRDADPMSPWLEGTSVAQRRARHVVTENARVLRAVQALRDESLTTLGRLLSASHASQRDDYETSTPEIDALVAIAEDDAEVFGARLTGGGFGGSVVILSTAAAAPAAAERILAAYQQRTGRHGTILLPPAAPPGNSAPRDRSIELLSTRRK